MESTPARKAAIKETSTPMRQPYHRRLGAAIERLLLGFGRRRVAGRARPACGRFGAGLGGWVVGASRGLRRLDRGAALVAVVALRHSLGAGSSPGLLGGAGGVPI